MKFNPLYVAGIHDKNEIEIIGELIDNFAKKAKREHIWDRFKAFIDEVKKIGIDFEVWLDGSFVTDKEEPGDIDVIFFFSNSDLASLSPDQNKYVSFLFGKPSKSIIKARYECDVFVCPKEDLNMRSYWRGWFGFTRSEEPKGIVRFIR